MISAIVYSFVGYGQTNPMDSNGIVKTVDSLSLNKDSTKKAGLTTSPFNSKVNFKAKDSILIDIAKKRVYLFGEAEVYYEKIELKGAKMTLDFTTSELTAEHTKDSTGKKTGLATFKEGEQTFEADKIGYQFKTKRAKISNLVMKEGEGIIYGSKVKKDEHDNVYVGDAKYTTCNAEEPHFYLHASRLKIIPGKLIVTGPANLVIGDVPTPGWVPFGFFPVQKGRKSGIMMPGYGFSPGQGYFLRNGGYYYGGSEYVDAAITGDAFTQGSYAVRLASSYARRYRYGGNINIAYANNQFGTPEDITGFSRTRNYQVQWNHRLDPKARPNTNFNANVNYQSPTYQQFNSYQPANIVQSQVNSSINYNKVMGGGKYNLGLTATASQNNQTKDVNITLPELNFDVLRFFPLKRKKAIGEERWYEKIGANYSFNAKNSINTKDSLLLNENTLKNMQNGGLHRAALSTQFKVLKYFSLSPQLSVSDYWYIKSIRKSWNADSMRVETDTVNGFTRVGDFTFSTSLTTMLYGTKHFKNSKRLKAIRHVMTVSANMGFRPDFSDAGFRIYNRVQSDTSGNFTTYSKVEGGIFGGPAPGRQGSLGLGINNNLELKWRKYNDTGFEDVKVKLIESFNFSTSYNFFATRNHLADINANARTVLFKQLNIMLNGFNFSPYGLDSNDRVSDKYIVNETGQLARFTSGSVAVSTSINSTMFDGQTTDADKTAPQPGVNRLQQAAMATNPYLTAYDLAMLSSMGDFVDFKIPWSLTLNYSYNYSKPVREKFIRQNITFSGDMNLTENWKIAFSSGYDLTQKEVNLTSIDFYRQLHCWEFRFSWIPLGPRQYYLFNLNVKSSILQDLKINRRRDWFDN